MLVSAERTVGFLLQELNFLQNLSIESSFLFPSPVYMYYLRLSLHLDNVHTSSTSIWMEQDININVIFDLSIKGATRRFESLSGPTLSGTGSGVTKGTSPSRSFLCMVKLSVVLLKRTHSGTT